MAVEGSVPSERRPAPQHLYVHVPFCREKCDYCDFFSLPLAPGVAGLAAAGRPAGADAGAVPASSGADAAVADVDLRDGAVDLLDRFVDALLHEWEVERRAGVVRRLHTVYLGGGTPSLLGPARLERIVAALQQYLTPAAEVSVEANPEDVDEKLARWAAQRGARVSLGVQSFDPMLRRTVGRRAAGDPAAAYRRLRRAGVTNVGMDLMFGLPGQTMADIEAELATVATLRPDHVSWYELEVTVGTPLASRLGAGRPPASVASSCGLETAAASARPDVDQRAEMYRAVVRGLERLGLHWYEVSNFSRPGRRCRHNMAVWRGRDYLGLGPGSVSTLGGLRRRDVPDVSAYFAALVGGGRAAGDGPVAERLSSAADLSGTPPAASRAWARRRDAPPREIEWLTPRDRLRERLYLAARIGLPLPLDEVSPVLDMAEVERLSSAGFVTVAAPAAGGTLRVTRKGRYVADDVCVRLFRASHVEGTA